MTNQRLYNLRAGNIKPANLEELKILETYQADVARIFDQEMSKRDDNDERHDENCFDDYEASIFGNDDFDVNTQD